MAKSPAKKPTKGFEETLWDTANQLRGSVESSEYKHVVLSLVFLKFISDKFEAKRSELIKNGQEAFVDMDVFYQQDNVFFLPQQSRWSYVQERAKQDDIAVIIDTALSTIEKSNASLTGALPDNYFSRQGLEPKRLASLIDSIENIDTLATECGVGEEDLVGRVYEYFLGRFAASEGKGGGEFYTPKSVVTLLAEMLEPYQGKVYDPCCGSGGMLTESQNFIEENYPNDSRDIYLYGKEINDETYAICKSDMMIKGNNPENIKVGSTLSTDEFAASRFDFMLSNPPYGKSWASEQKYIKDGSDVIDPRFKVSLKDYWGNLEVVDATPRSSDGQLLFLMEMVNKMKDPSVSPLGSRIASVHNGSSLFTGDAGGGESNIRRFIIENDMLDAIVQLPNNLFYNTGITTYIWVLNNNKPEARKGKVQLIDASLLYRKLRKNLGNKNCEFAPEHITEITDTYLACKDVERALDANNDPVGIASKVFSNDDFGYYKVTIERPDRRKAKFTQDAIAPLRFDRQLSEVMEYVYAEHGERVYEKTGYGSDQKKSFLKSIEKDILSWCEENDISLNAKAKAKLLDVKHWLALKALLETAQTLMVDIGSIEFDDFNSFKTQVDKSLKNHAIKLSASEKNAILHAVSWYDETAKKVVKKVVKLTGDKLNDLLERYECEVADLPDFGYYPVPSAEGGKKGEYITYETNSDLRDTESVPLKQSIYQYFLDEVKPHVDEAWINLDTVKIGYEISFNKYFYRHKPLRSLEEVATDIINLEQKAEGLIAQILGAEVKKVQG
ncbi:type I restriction-modification system subunit M [Providencia huaxiensis]|uniref:type I restriction-modification system subunit M n=1 Tax=Providencia huaxiensis TaxID=2027290 RepID=UPI0034E521CD